ncbi:MBL fold metallo-hydrolase [Paenibacillus hemerocallicola]|uniref:MBL fold metallo-hydrolase n=1 Tax=Paenibacillus hemerocallicola TaxID=1172614 RepID=A0A5C4TA33_9BACL|nr:MBL fold metallo-hydrolase [Paenibacillus hemerocallicola]TNJ65470.1 MBL fold metallo-hydrolase [Paenibacillus hemerocallicola]
MQIANGIAALPISTVMLGRTDTIYPTLLWDSQTMVLVDTGYPGQSDKFREQIADVGLSGRKLGHIIITHQDLDHIGSLPALLDSTSEAIEVLASAVEQPYIQGERPLVKLSPEAIAQAVVALPPDVPNEWRQAFKHTLEHPPRANVSRTVTDGQQLPYCGGITVIGTPGHTPGHISLYHGPSKTLIAADALIVSEGQLYGPTPEHAYDIGLAKQSLNRLLRYDIETVICYHGGVYRGNANERLAQIIGK